MLIKVEGLKSESKYNFVIEWSNQRNKSNTCLRNRWKGPKRYIVLIVPSLLVICCLTYEKGRKGKKRYESELFWMQDRSPSEAWHRAKEKKWNPSSFKRLTKNLDGWVHNFWLSPFIFAFRCQRKQRKDSRQWLHDYLSCPYNNKNNNEHQTKQNIDSTYTYRVPSYFSQLHCSYRIPIQ